MHEVLVITLRPEDFQVARSLQKAGAAPDPAFGCGPTGEVACSHMQLPYMWSHGF